jgi:hypothetical protein
LQVLAEVNEDARATLGQVLKLLKKAEKATPKPYTKAAQMPAPPQRHDSGASAGELTVKVCP